MAKLRIKKGTVENVYEFLKPLVVSVVLNLGLGFMVFLELSFSDLVELVKNLF